MPQYKYFEQQGSKYFFKNDKAAVYLGAGTWFGIGLLCIFFMPKEEKFGLYFGIFFIVIGLLIFIKTTKKFTIDTSTRTVSDKHNVFAGEKTYHFDQFLQFHMSTYYVSFIKTNCMGSVIFDHKGKEKHVMLVSAMFTAKPAQRAINEASEIMGFEAGL